MVVVQLPKPDVDDIEIFVAEEVRVKVDIRFCLNIEQTLQDIGFLELSKAHLVVILPIGHVEHAMDDTEGIPFLKFRSVFEEVQARMDLQYLLE